jgi:hypothetical protein
VDPQLQPLTFLPQLHPDLPLVVAIEAEGEPHDAVEAVFVAMPETHQRDLAKVVRTPGVEVADDGRCCCHCGHAAILRRPTDNSAAHRARPAPLSGRR